MSTSEPQQPAPRKRPDYDSALKRMLTQAHDGFLHLLASDDRWIGERSTELQAAARRVDLVWEVESLAGERGLKHIELQIQPDGAIGERMAEYGVGLWLRDHLPVHSVVVFLRPAATVPVSPFVIQWKGQESLRYTYGVVRLWEIPAEQVLNTTHYALWPLATLMGNVTIESATAVAERIANAPLPLDERGELTGLLVVLSEVRLGKGTLLQVLRRNTMIDELVKNSGLAEEFLEEGRREGRAEGRTEGRAEGMCELVQSILEARFGPLSADLLAALTAADESTLRTLGIHAGGETLEQIRGRLGLS